MISTKKLKIWTMVTHGLIIIGMGHGIACLGILEMFWFYGCIKAIFDLSFSLFVTTISPVVILSLLGQAAVLFSLFNKDKTYKTISYIVFVRKRYKCIQSRV
jgi:hypothetical protein